MDRILQNMRANFLEILESKNSKISKIARPNGQDFPKHKGEVFGNFGTFGEIFGSFGILEVLEYLENLEILEFWKFWKSRKFGGENIENFGIDFGRADCHPPDDRPCMTTHKKGHGVSTGGERPYTKIYMEGPFKYNTTRWFV